MNINLTLLGQMLSFAVFVWICMAYIWPPVINAMRERQERIARGLAQAERAERDLELAQKRAAEHIGQARSEAQAILEQARQRAAQIVDDAKELARQEGDRIREGARQDAEQEFARVRETVRKQVAELAVAGAEKILRESVDADRHRAMLDRLASEL
jgi:F-type H+-transporting ATPase subunit b